jgi:hypothetical protein
MATMPEGIGTPIPPGSTRSFKMGTPSAPGTHLKEAGNRITGVEEALPPGEAVLWEGAPEALPLALRVLYLRALLFYWALVAVGFLAFSALGGRALGALAADLAWLLVVAGIGSGLIWGLARAVRRTTTYALTNRRMVIRLGVAFPSVLNLPLRRIDSVDLRGLGHGVGDIVLTPVAEDRIGWLYLWPHVKPWAWRDPIPALRAVADAEAVGRLIAAEVARERGEEERP